MVPSSILGAASAAPTSVEISEGNALADHLEQREDDLFALFVVEGGVVAEMGELVDVRGRRVVSINGGDTTLVLPEGAP